MIYNPNYKNIVEQVQENKDNIEALQEVGTTLQNRVTTLETEVEANDNDITSLSGRVTDNTIDIDRIGGQASTNASHITQLHEDLEEVEAIANSKLSSVQASNIDSENEAQGLVLTSDGSGGATWEEAQGGVNIPYIEVPMGTISISVDSSYTAIISALKVNDYFYLKQQTGTNAFSYFSLCRVNEIDSLNNIIYFSIQPFVYKDVTVTSRWYGSSQNYKLSGPYYFTSDRPYFKLIGSNYRLTRTDTILFTNAMLDQTKFDALYASKTDFSDTKDKVNGVNELADKILVSSGSDSSSWSFIDDLSELIDITSATNLQTAITSHVLSYILGLGKLSYIVEDVNGDVLEFYDVMLSYQNNLPYFYYINTSGAITMINPVNLDATHYIRLTFFRNSQDHN